MPAWLAWTDVEPTRAWRVGRALGKPPLAQGAGGGQSATTAATTKARANLGVTGPEV